MYTETTVEKTKIKREIEKGIKTYYERLKVVVVGS